MRLLLVALLVLVIAVSAATARTWYINPDGTGDAPTIQAGIDSAAAGDTVLVASGYYGEHDIEMKSGVCLRSENGDPDSVVIDASRYNRVLYCQNVDSTATIEGFQLLRAMGGNGGGLHCLYSSPSVRNCVFLANSVGGHGAALFCDHSSPEITHCIFSNNDADSSGGAIHCRSSSPIMRDCFFTWNYTRRNGAAVSCWDNSLPILRNCTFADNWADSAAGGIDCSGASLRLVNCTFWNNHGGDHSSGLLIRENSSVTIENTIIAFGVASQAVACLDNSTVALSCCDIYGNVGGDWAGCIADQFGTNGNISADPRFCDPENDDFHLWATSRCARRLGCGVIGALGVGCGLRERRINEDIPPAMPAKDEEQCCYDPVTLNCATGIDDRIVVQLSLSDEVPICLTIHDVRGRIVKTLADRSVFSGEYSVVWDGLGDNGRHVAPGVYFIRLRAGSQTVTKKVALVR